MKKSNKLLLGGFLAVILLISAIHISLYAKYKAGDFTIYNAQDDLAAESMQSFPNILFVSVRNISGATVQFSDVAKVEKLEEGDIQYTRRGDTLLITGPEKTDRDDNYYPVTFYLPHNATVSAFNSSLSFKANKKPAENNPVIYLQKSVAYFSGAPSPLSLGHVKVIASDSSIALFRGNTQVAHLEVQLSKSEIEFAEGNFGQLSILTDSVSRISLQSKHLLKANIKTTTQQ